MFEGNSKSDFEAKNAFVKDLALRGFRDIRIINSPCDIIALKNGRQHYFEVKYTKRGTNGDTKPVFGAATLTEWECALNNEDTFWFVIVSFKNKWVFHEYTPDEFMKFSTIPPFKIYLDVPNKEEKATSPDNDRSRTVKATRENIKSLLLYYKSLRYPDSESQDSRNPISSIDKTFDLDLQNIGVSDNKRHPSEIKGDEHNIYKASHSLFQIGRQDDALKLIQVAIDVFKPENPNFLEHKGDILVRLERFDEAFDTYLEIFPIEGDYEDEWNKKLSWLIDLGYENIREKWFGYLCGLDQDLEEDEEGDEFSK
jgi:tetratricopeptide (TPR) repeat protein